MLIAHSYRMKWYIEIEPNGDGTWSTSKRDIRALIAWTMPKYNYNYYYYHYNSLEHLNLWNIMQIRSFHSDYPPLLRSVGVETLASCAIYKLPQSRFVSIDYTDSNFDMMLLFLFSLWTPRTNGLQHKT